MHKIRACIILRKIKKTSAESKICAPPYFVKHLMHLVYFNPFIVLQITPVYRRRYTPSWRMSIFTLELDTPDDFGSLKTKNTLLLYVLKRSTRGLQLNSTCSIVVDWGAHHFYHIMQCAEFNHHKICALRRRLYRRLKWCLMWDAPNITYAPHVRWTSIMRCL